MFFLHILFVGGMIAGGWKKEVGKKEAIIEVETVGILTKAEKTGLEKEVERYGKFAGMKTEVRLKA
jgi:hypothetical protein